MASYVINPQTGEKIDIETYYRPGDSEAQKTQRIQELLNQGYLPQDMNGQNYLSDKYGINANGNYEDNANLASGQLTPETLAMRNAGIDIDKLQGSFNAASYLQSQNPYQSMLEEGANTLWQEANAEGPSKWTQALIDQQTILGQGEREGLQKQGASDYATAYSYLASSGGIDSGARERLNTNMMNQNMYGVQKQYQNEAATKLGLLGEGEQWKINQLQNNPYASLSDTYMNTAGSIYGMEEA